MNSKLSWECGKFEKFTVAWRVSKALETGRQDSLSWRPKFDKFHRHHTRDTSRGRLYICGVSALVPKKAEPCVSLACIWLLLRVPDTNENTLFKHCFASHCICSALCDIFVSISLRHLCPVHQIKAMYLVLDL